MKTVASKLKGAAKWELLNSGLDAHCFSPASLSFITQKGTAFLLGSSQFHNLFLFHTKDRNKNNGKKDMIISCTEFLFLSSISCAI